MKTGWLAVVAALVATGTAWGDWPTYLHDNERSGQTTEKIELPLSLRWVHIAAQPPAPAWPLPAKQDFWHKLYDLPARMVFDRAFAPVSDGQRLFFGSSADDTVYCLDADTGQQLWSFVTEGPVRLAPTVASDRLLLGSDDGHVYCLKTTDGALLWKTRIGPGSRQIAGNERLISAWPIRTGVLVEEGKTALCCAGFFPEEGVYNAALDVATGKILSRVKINAAAQGYLARKGEKLVVATGQDPAGATLGKMALFGKAAAKQIQQLSKDYPFSWIGTTDLRCAGGDGKVAAFSAKDGKLLWSAPVEGKAYGLIIAGGQLFVSTDQGKLYCFGTGPKVKPKPQPEPKPFGTGPEQKPYAQAVAWILDTAGCDRGYALILGGGEGRLAYELAQRSKFQIVMLQADKQQAAAARHKLAAAGLYGRVVVQDLTDAEKLPFTDYLFNLVIRDGTAGPPVPPAEAKRVLRPYGGVGIWNIAGKDVYRSGPLAGAGAWTHFYADPGNTACSMDERVKGPLALQWFGQPGPREMIDRHHRTVAPLWQAGRLIIPGNDRIFAADAYNGALLWEVEIKNSRRVGAFRDCSYLVATEDLIYVAAEDKCFALDAPTGAKKLTFQVPKAADGKPRDWGYVACVGDLLVGSTTKPGASRREQSFKAIDDTYYDARPLVCSDSLFVMDRHGPPLHWTYTAKKGAILNPTLAIGAGMIFFVESSNPATLKTADGRASPAALLADGAELVALDLKTGAEVWRRAHDFSKIEHVLYLSYAQDKVVAVGSRNNGKKAWDKVLFDLAVFSAKTGTPGWQHTQTQPTAIGGSHGEQDHHPVIVGDKLYCEPFGYALHTGKPLADFAWNPAHRAGCGTLSASAALLFFRQSCPTLFDLESNKYAKVTSCTRTGCWINMIPAGGLLLIPEASSGCTCNYAVQTSLAFLPVPKQE
jgi:outer membrane protein assembly factor BamB